MANANSPRSDDEQHLRVDLAAAFRLAADFDWHESVGNHFTVTLAPGSSQFLMNPRWVHFSRLRARDLLVLDVDDPETAKSGAVDEVAWGIHSRLHAELPHVRCLLHLHPPYSTALATLADPELKAIDQNTARFYARVAIDRSYGATADGRAEGQRLARILGNRSIMIMGNHGVLVAGKSIAHAFDELYFLERAAQTLIFAYATGRPLQVMSDDLAARTAEDWERYSDMSVAHFSELKKILDSRNSTYAQ